MDQQRSKEDAKYNSTDRQTDRVGERERENTGSEAEITSEMHTRIVDSGTEIWPSSSLRSILFHSYCILCVCSSEGSKIQCMSNGGVRAREWERNHNKEDRNGLKQVEYNCKNWICQE